MADAEKGKAVLDQARARRPNLVDARTRLGAVRDLWKRGLPPGDRTGWPSLDQHLTIAEGQLVVVTGWPGSGKSEWLDALLINLARQGWRHCVFSPENQPIDLHIAKLLEKVGRKPFQSGPSARMTLSEVDEYSDDLAQWFSFIEPPESGESLTAAEVIEAAEPWFATKAEHKRALVIDPWNELEHWRPANLTETEYVSKTLSHVRNWARRAKVTVFIVAHPAKMRREEGKLPIPRPDMIAGSQHWWNKADVALTVWRDFEKMDAAEVHVHVQKVRFKHIGRPGVVELRYDRVTGTYAEPAKPLDGRSFRERLKREEEGF